MKRAYSIIVGCQVATAFASILALRLISLYVPPDVLGRFTLFQSVVTAASMLLINWPNAAILRYGREEWIQRGHLGTTAGTRLLIFAVSEVAVIAALWQADPWLRSFMTVSGSPFWWILAAVIAIPALELVTYLAQAVGWAEAYGYGPLVTRTGFLVGIAAIPLFGASWGYLATALILSTFLATLVITAKLGRRIWSGLRFHSEHVRLVLKYSWAVPFAAASVYVVNWVDTWMLREFKGVASVGIYNWAYQTTALAGMSLTPIAAILTPRVVDARVVGQLDRLNEYARAILPAVVFVAVCTTVGMLAVFPALTLAVGPSYHAAFPVIVILLAAFPFQLLGYLATPLGNAHERLIPRFAFVGAAVAALNTLGDFILVPRLGATGAAISTAAAFVFGGVAQATIVRGCAEFQPTWKFLVIPLGFVAPVAGALVVLGPMAGAALAAALAVVWVVAIQLGRYARPEDRRNDPRTLLQLLIQSGRALTLSGVRPDLSH